MLRNLGLNLNPQATRGYVTNRLRQVPVMNRIRDALESLAEDGVDLLDNLSTYFNSPDGPTTIRISSADSSPIATLGAILTTAPAPDPLADYRYIIKIIGTESFVNANGDPDTREVSIVRPMNDQFSTYGTNAIWAFLNNGSTAYASDDYYDISQYQAISEWENVVIEVVRIPQGPAYGQPGGSFWSRWMMEHIPDDLSKYQVYKESQIKALSDLLKEGVEVEVDLFAEPDCLGFSLFVGGIEPEKLKKFYLYTARNATSFFPSTKMNDMCVSTGIRIDFRKYDRKKQDSTDNKRFCPPLKKGETSEGYIPIGRLGNHYFLDEESNWTGPAARNFDRNWEFMEDRASQMPPGYYFDKNSRHTVSGERLLRKRIQRGVEPKKITVGELLCIFTFGTSDGKQSSVMNQMKLTDYAMRTDCFLEFKDQFRNQNLNMDEAEFDALIKDGVAKEYEKKGHENILTFTDGHYMGWNEYSRLNRTGGIKSNVQENVLERYEYPQLNRLLDAKKCSFKEGPSWKPRDRFGITGVRGKGRHQVKYFIPLKYTVIAFDTETYMKEDTREAVPYMISVAYYQKEEEVFDFREWDEIKIGSGPENYGAELVCHTETGPNCCEEMFNWVAQNPAFSDRYLVFMAHNLNFDFNRLLRHASNLWVTGGIFKSVSKTDCVNAILCPKKTSGGLYYGRQIYFMDSLSLTQMKLAKFAESFQLDGIQKEIMPYDYYTETNLEKWSIENRVPLCEALLKAFPNNDKKQEEFKDAIEKSGSFIDIGQMRDDVFMSYFLPLDYAKFYCEQDCRVLMKGLMAHRTGCYNVPLIDPDPNYETPTEIPCEIDILNCISVPQYATFYLGLNGSFAGAYDVSGVIRDYIARSVVGGRCMVEGNIPHMHGKGDHKGKEEPIKEGEHIVEDFDACSLYPTAMWRGCSKEHGHKGYPKGKPKFWKEGVDLSTCNQYYITVRITKVGKPRRFPLFPSSKPGGGRHWSNDVIGMEFVFDKVQWEDVQEFQEAEGEIVCGVYFNEGGNPRIGECMTFLYQNRLDEKKKENEYAKTHQKPVCRAQSNLRKLIMNSSYGRMIMNPIEKEIKFVYGRDLIEKFCINHHHTISELAPVRDYDASKPLDMKLPSDFNAFYIFQKRELVKQQEHRSLPHWGCFVLSESKRVMNEIMCAAEDVEARIHYQDTDSMHIVKEHIPKLEEEIQKRYGHRELGPIISGKDGVKEALGRFHGDFAPLVYDASKSNQYHAPISLYCIFIGKKMYFDYLIQHHKEDPSQTLVGAHAKMKGIPTKVVTMYSKKKFENEKDTNRATQLLFTQLLLGNRFSFNLTDNGVKFKNTRDGRTIYLDKFERNIGMQMDDAKLAINEWKKWFPNTECPNPYLENQIRSMEEEKEDLFLVTPPSDIENDDHDATRLKAPPDLKTSSSEDVVIPENRKRPREEEEEPEWPDDTCGEPGGTPPRRKLRRLLRQQLGHDVGY